METWPANTLVASGRLLPLGTLGERKTEREICAVSGHYTSQSLKRIFKIIVEILFNHST